MRGRSHGICGLTYDIDMASLPLTRCTGPHLHLHRQGPCLPVRCVDGSTRSLVPGQAVHALANEADGTQGKLCSVDPDLYGVNVIADVPPPGSTLPSLSGFTSGFTHLARFLSILTRSRRVYVELFMYHPDVAPDRLLITAILSLLFLACEGSGPR